MGTVDKAVEPEVVWLLCSGVVVMLLLATALIVFFVLYQKKLIAQQLALHTLQSAAQKEAFSAAIEAQERERQRIGSDLHDEVGSSLSAAKVFMLQLRDAVTRPKDQEVLTLIEGILSNSLRDIRHISQNLHPAVLAQFGLADAIHNLGSRYAEALPEGFRVEVEMTATLSQQQELALYRIVQELVGNVLRHAQASWLLVQLLQQPHLLLLTVTDNGCGFDYDRVLHHHKTSLGLRNLQARVSLLNAAFSLGPAMPQGTCVRIEIPLPDAL